MIKNDKGLTLIEVLVAFSLMIVLSLAVAEILVSQGKEVRSLNEKLATTDMETIAKKLILNGQFCKCIFKGFTFNSTGKNWNSFPTGMAGAYDNFCNPIGKDLFKVGAKVPNSNIKVSSFQMVNINEITPSSGNYTGQLEVKFNSNDTVRALKNLYISLGFTVSGPPGAQNVSECGVETSGLGNWTPMSNVPGITTQATADGFLVITSCHNCGIRFSTGTSPTFLTQRSKVSARDKYGQGNVTMTVPIKKNDFYKIETLDGGGNPAPWPLQSVFFQPF